MAGLGGVMQGGVARLVLPQQMLGRQDLGRQFAEPPIPGCRVQRGIAGGVGRGEVRTVNWCTGI